ncbi:MAG: hypothetical protein OXG71_01660 [Rhodospirillales bacterium]|nr:hypothetical protein [Rhodospirillales bacterium]
MAETATPRGRIARNDRTVETAATTTFRGLSSPGLLKASGDSAQDPSLEENKLKNRRRRARLKVIDEGDAFEMTARMLGLATSLRRAAEILDQARNEGGAGRNREDFSAAFHGAPILRAQSAEIALKALWRIGHNQEHGEPPHHHNLTDLHDAPTETIQELLAEEFPEIRDPSCPHFPIPVRQGLRSILNEHETALEDWRYSYELGSLRFEHVFGEVLNTLISVGWQLHNLWLRRLREDGAQAPSRP